MSEPAALPDGWLDAKPWSPEFIAAANELAQARVDWIASDREAHALFRQPLSVPVPRGATEGDDAHMAAQELAEARLEMRKADRFFAAVERLATIPDYDLAGLIDRREGYEVPQQSYVDGESAGLAYRFAPKRVAVLAADGEIEKAYEAALSLLMLARRGPISDSISDMLARQCAATAAEALERLAREHPDAEMIRKALIQLESAERDSFLFVEPDDLLLNDVAASLRQYQRMGFPLLLPPRATGSDLLWRQHTAMEEYPAWRMPQTVAGSFEQAVLRGFSPPPPTLFPGLPTFDPGPSFVSRGARWMGLKRPLLELLYKTRHGGNADVRAYEYRRALAMGRLARLALARRFAELSPTERPTFLDAGLPDPFDPAGEKLRWSEKIGAYYSVGPDGVDDQCATLHQRIEFDTGKGDLAIGALEDEAARARRRAANEARARAALAPPEGQSPATPSPAP